MKDHGAESGLSPCAECGQDPGSSLACLACGVLREEPAGSNVFTRFGLTPTPRVDVDAIELHYLRLSRLLHPDFQAGKPPAVQDLAVSGSALLNEAYTTLLDDQRRLEAALALLDPDALERNKTLSPAFLMESMESSEEIEDARASGDDEALKHLAAGMRAVIDARLASAADHLTGDGDPDAVATLLHETRVFRRMLRDTGP